MANRILESFPMITEEALKELQPKIDWFAKYDFNNLAIYMNVEKLQEGNDYFLDDPAGKWNPKNNKLYLQGKVTLENVNVLFDKYRVADYNSILGVAVVCNSKKTSKTFTKSIGEIKYNQGNREKEFKIGLQFDEGELAIKLNIKIIIYLKEVSNFSKVFANSVGTELGEIIDSNIVFEGNGSIFPIEIVEKRGEPIWNMSINYEQLSDELNIDTMGIQINAAHKDFKYLQIDSINDKNSFFWKEILASFFENILLEVNRRDEICSFVNDEQLGKGTIGEFIKYIYDSFNISNIELNNPSLLSKKIRRKLDGII